MDRLRKPKVEITVNKNLTAEETGGRRVVRLVHIRYTEGVWDLK